MKSKKIPMRTCVGCTTSLPKNQLIRMVNNNGKILVDKSGTANGRGIYLCQNNDCFEKANKRRAFNRSFKMDISPDDINQLRLDLGLKDE